MIENSFSHMCSPSTIVVAFCCYYCWCYCVVEHGFSQWVHPKEQQTRETTACICVYIYILNWFLPLVCPSNKQHFMKRVPPNDFTRQEILCWLCSVFCLCLCCFPSLGLLLFFFCCCCVSIPVFHLFVLNMVSPNGFARRVYAYLSCVHAVVIQYVLFNSIYIRIDLI